MLSQQHKRPGWTKNAELWGWIIHDIFPILQLK